MQALERADHPTATELYEYVQAENPRISKATVFRVLSQYSENGEIRRLHLRGTDERYDATLAPHAHMRCAFCGKISDVMFPGLESVFGAEELGGYRIFLPRSILWAVVPTARLRARTKRTIKTEIKGGWRSFTAL